ncbi:MAG: imidazole glycerol phosphate synthase subunit HisH [Holdemanella sp.]|nr:imidazole glycerol phosphate synthase subunit HisH [Holdemanella sp.]
MIGIIDYGMGNLRSVENALLKIGKPCIITKDKTILSTCDKWILPGVGAFQDMMKNIEDCDLYDFIKEEVGIKKKPLLGICLGMQALFDSSSENGYTKGFGFIKGDVLLMEDETVRIPHIGWNLLERNGQHVLFDRMSSKPFMYYVHSYCAMNYENEDLYGYSMYGSLKIPGLVGHDNVLGCQFHPEKSGEDGLKILQYFVEEFI